MEQQLDIAREALQNAEKAYARTSSETDVAPESSEAKTLGTVIDDALGFVRRHPGAGVVTASTVGFLIGRLTRRLF